MSFIKIIFFISLLQASVLKHEVSSPTFTEFDFKDVCLELGVKEPILITPKGLSEIECFNKTFPLIDFCLKKLPNHNNLTRGFIDEAKKKVICEKSDSVMLSIGCDQKHFKYCFKPEKGCEELRKIYAAKLDLAHFSMLEKNLNCYFAKPIGENFNEN